MALERLKCTEQVGTLLRSCLEDPSNADSCDGQDRVRKRSIEGHPRMHQQTNSVHAMTTQCMLNAHGNMRICFAVLKYLYVIMLMSSHAKCMWLVPRCGGKMCQSLVAVKTFIFVLPQVIFFTAAGDCCFCVAGAAF